MAIKILIVLAGCWVLYVKIIKNQDITEMWESVKLSFSSTKNVLLMILAFVLMPVNMAFETRNGKNQYYLLKESRLGKPTPLSSQELLQE